MLSKFFKVLSVICMLIVFSFVLVACAAPAGLTASLVAMPEELSLLIVALVTAGVTWLLLQLANALKIDLAGYVAPIVAIISPILITLIESWLQLIPPAWDNIALTVIHLIVLLVSSLGIYVATARVKNKETKSLLK